MTVVYATKFGVVLMCLMSESLHWLGFGVSGRIKAQLGILIDRDHPFQKIVTGEFDGS